jgi:hypothetical protein
MIFMNVPCSGYFSYFSRFGARCSEVGWGTMLQAGSIPDEVIGFFNFPTPSSRNMAQWSTQPLK